MKKLFCKHDFVYFCEIDYKGNFIEYYECLKCGKIRRIK